MAPGSALVRSPLLKLVAIGVLTVLMVVPLLALSILRGERSQRAAEVMREVAASWAGDQAVVGPILLLPYIARVQDQGNERSVRRTLAVLPETMHQNGHLRVEYRRRGIFDVPVWRGDVGMEARFGTVDVTRIDGAAVAPVWEDAVIAFHVADPRGLEREVSLRIGDTAVVLEPGATGFGTQMALLSAPAAGVDGRQPFTVTGGFSLRGARTFGVVPVGRTSTVSLSADWAHPSFFGAYLPGEREVGADGFRARWSVPHYARPVAQAFIAEAAPLQRLFAARSGVTFYQPVDLYQTIERALKYGLLVIGAAFVAVFLIEVLGRRAFHPVQYLMVGAALTVFYLLLLSLSEHIGFAPAYGLASAATIALVSLYVGLAFRRLREGLAVAAELALAYGLLYVVLRSEDYALLTGSVVVFIALAAVMFATVRTDWSATASPTPEKPAAEGSTIG